MRRGWLVVLTTLLAVAGPAGAQAVPVSAPAAPSSEPVSPQPAPRAAAAEPQPAASEGEPQSWRAVRIQPAPALRTPAASAAAPASRPVASLLPQPGMPLMSPRAWPPPEPAAPSAPPPAAKGTPSAPPPPPPKVAEPERSVPMGPPLPRVGTPLLARPRPPAPPPPPVPPVRPVEHRAPAPEAPKPPPVPPLPREPVPDMPVVGTPLFAEPECVPYSAAFHTDPDQPFCRPKKKRCPPEYEAHVWVTADFLLWWIRDARIPYLLTTSATTTPIFDGRGNVLNGTLGEPATSVLLGDKFDYGTLPGGRLTVGFAHESELIGLEASAFLLPGHQKNFQFASTDNGFPVLVRPFRNLLEDRETGFAVAFPNAFSGSVTVTSTSQLWGSEVNGLLALLGNCWAHVDGLLGFRYADLEEDLTFTNQSSFALPGGVIFFNGTPFLTPIRDELFDRFSTRNQFYGGQIGTVAEVRLGCLFVDLTTKVAFGVTHHVVDISGNSVLIPPDAPRQTATGGLLALPSNIGRYTNEFFTVMPEVQLQFGYQICRNLRAYAGYSYLYWSSVVRPGDQINRLVNEQQLPTSPDFGPVTGPREPSHAFRYTPFWAHGVTFGVSVRY